MAVSPLLGSPLLWACCNNVMFTNVVVLVKSLKALGEAGKVVADLRFEWVVGTRGVAAGGGVATPTTLV